MRLSCLLLLLTAAGVLAQKEPTLYPPDAATLKRIQEKTAELKTAVEALKPEKFNPAKSNEWYINGAKWADVAVCLKAAEWIGKYDEWFTKDSVKQTLSVLEIGLQRASLLKDGKSPWRDVRGKPVVRGLISSVDGSVQPYCVTYPEGYGKDGKKYRLDLVLHGRDANLSEVKFIASHENAKPAAKPNDYIVVEPYGRGNNAYRWAGETDVMECVSAALVHDTCWEPKPEAIDRGQIVVRGFSMGGAGTWHIGLHHSTSFRVIAPGAGFTVTRGYIKNLPEKLPDYVERCLHIYDAADYAENLSLIPCVAYSGEIDPQRAAVTNIEARLKAYPEKLRFTHIIGTGLEHKMPPEWWAKVDAEIRNEIVAGRAGGEHSHLVTYTARYAQSRIGHIVALERHYEKTIYDAHWSKKDLEIKTQNVHAFAVSDWQYGINPTKITIDGQVMPTDEKSLKGGTFAKEKGKWSLVKADDHFGKLHKLAGLQGPIDDAFQDPFAVVGPSAKGWNSGTDATIAKRLTDFDHLWNKYFRSPLPMLNAEEKGNPFRGENMPLILFGDPASNPEIAKVVGILPIKWTKDVLEVNDKEYDPKTHFPVMIYPNPHRGWKYLVLNSGHTFGEADLKGTNALLYPRLGDWAVLKLAPTKDDPQHTEVVDAGIFDENWQFEKKK